LIKIFNSSCSLIGGSSVRYYSLLRSEWNTKKLQKMIKYLQRDQELSNRLVERVTPVISNYVQIRSTGIDPLLEEITITGNVPINLY